MYVLRFIIYVCLIRGTRWREWLSHCATSRKVAGSISDDVNWTFIDLNLPAALWPRSLLSLRKEYQGYLLESKGSRCVQLTTLPLSCVDRLVILGSTNSWSPKGLFRPVMGQLYLLFMINSKVNFYKNGSIIR